MSAKSDNMGVTMVAAGYGVKEGDKRIGATQESLDALMESLNKAKEAARLAPPGDEYTKVAEYFAMPVMVGDAKMILDIPEEEQEKVYKKVGEGFIKSFAESGAQKMGY